MITATITKTIVVDVQKLAEATQTPATLELTVAVNGTLHLRTNNQLVVSAPRGSTLSLSTSLVNGGVKLTVVAEEVLS